MKIAIIGAKGLPSLFPIGGGVESHVDNLVHELVDDGFKVSVYIRQYANPRQRKTFNKIKLITLPSWQRKNFDTITHVFLATLHALTQDYDIIHYHGVGPASLAWIPRLFKRRTKVIATFHSQDKFHSKWGFLARLYLSYSEWATVFFPHKTIAVSHSIKKFCDAYYKQPKKVIYIPNAVKIPAKKINFNLLTELNIKPNKYFLILARLIPHKAQDVAIKAFAKVKTDMNLVIAGSADFREVDYLEKLEALAKKDSRVKLVGKLSGELLEQTLAHCYSFIHPSRSEGLSISILEAMSHARLIIMSNIPENLELIDHSGLAFPIGDVDKLAELIQFAVDDPSMVTARGERARKFIKHGFTWRKVAKKTEALYKEVL